MKKTDFVCNGCAWRTHIHELGRKKTSRTRKPIPTAIEFIQEVGGKFCDSCTHHPVTCTRVMYYDEMPIITEQDHAHELCQRCIQEIILRCTGPGNWSWEKESTWRFPYKIMANKIESNEVCTNCHRDRITDTVTITPFPDDDSKCKDFYEKFLKGLR